MAGEYSHLIMYLIIIHIIQYPSNDRAIIIGLKPSNSNNLKPKIGMTLHVHKEKVMKKICEGGIKVDCIAT